MAVTWKLTADFLTIDIPTFAIGLSDASLTTGRDARLSVSVGFFLLVVTLAWPNGLPTLAHEF